MDSKYDGFFLASTVHVRRPTEAGDAKSPDGHKQVVILAGQYLKDVKPALTEDELESLDAQGVLRYPTLEEKRMLDDATRSGNHRKALEQAAQKARQAQMQQLSERDALKAKHQEQLDKALAELDEKHATSGEGGTNPALAGPPMPDDGQGGTGRGAGARAARGAGPGASATAGGR